MPGRQIIAVGGAILAPDPGSGALVDYIIAAADTPQPRVLFVGTATGDDPGVVTRFYETYGKRGARTSHLPFFRRTPLDLRGLLLEQDIVQIGGGNTRSMLAVWRDWGFDDALRAAWDAGVVLCGSSAGSICWFEQGVTDSLAGELVPLDCLGFLAGSNCPHYDGEKERRPSYNRFVAAGAMQGGYAADDGVGLHFRDRELTAIVTSRPAATAYRVDRDESGAAIERKLEATLVTEKAT
jgi:dipeptidase E